MTTCPYASDLQGMLDSELTAARQMELMDHVEACSTCQAELDMLTRYSADDFSTQSIAVDHALARSASTDDANDSRSKRSPEAPVIAGFEILDELGRGGMGVVYRARQLRLNRMVALKVILAGQHAASEQRLRFETEAEIAAQLQHPNIVQVYELGAHEGQPFFASEYIDGENLARAISAGRWPATGAEQLQRIARLIETIARGAHFAHEKGVVHRDLKPANILLASNSSSPKITDFGLAKFTGGDLMLTETGIVVGTPAYMAPEQALGENRDVGPAADTFTLGVILYELLTGSLPFSGATQFDTIRLIVGSDPVPPRRLNESVPRDLETICLRCLQKDPQRRYASARELADDLERFAQGQPVRARPVGALEKTWKWSRRRPAVATLLLLLVMSVVTGLSAVCWRIVVEYDLRLQAELAQTEALKQRKRAIDEKLEANRLRSEIAKAWDSEKKQRFWAEENLYFSRILNIDMLSQSRKNEAHAYLFECPKEMRGPEWYMLKQRLRPSLLTMVSSRRTLGDAVYSPDGRWLASGGSDGKIDIWDARTGTLKNTLRGGSGPITSIAFLPDGKHLASLVSGKEVAVFRLAGGMKVLAFTNESILHEGLAVSSDGKYLAGPHRDALRVWDLLAGKEFKTFSGGDGTICSVTFRRDTHQLVWCTMGGVIKMADLAKPSKLIRFPKQNRPIGSVCFVPGKKQLVSVSIFGHVVLWDIKTQKPTSLYNTRAPTGLGGSTASIDPTGRLLAFAAGSVYTIWLYDLRTRRMLLPLQGHSALISSLVYHPKGRYLLSSAMDGRLKIWDTQSLLQSGELMAIEKVKGVQVTTRLNQRSLAWHPQKHELAACYVNNKVIFWEAESGRRSKVLSAPAESAVSAIAYHPDGEQIAIGTSRGAIHSCRPAQGTKMKLLANGERYIRQLCYIPSGKALVVRDGRNTIRLVDARSGTIIRTFAQPKAIFYDGDIALSPDGKLLAAALGNVVIIWELATGNEHGRLSGHLNRITSVCWSRSGKYLATASADHTVRRWDAAHGNLLHTLRGHSQLVSDVAFSPDDKRLVSCGSDGWIKLWHLRTGKLV